MEGVGLASNVRIGNQHPTQSVILPYAKSDYKEAVSLYERSKRKVIPWQEHLLAPILATNDQGLWTHTKVKYLLELGRRQGG